MSALDELNDARRALREIANVPFVTPAAYQIAMRALAGKYREEGMSMKKDTGMQCVTWHNTGVACKGCGQCAKFKLGDLVRKTKGSQWSGLVVGTYSTELTPEGYAVESSTERGSVQIYPAAALEMVQPAAPVQAHPVASGWTADDQREQDYFDRWPAATQPAVATLNHGFTPMEVAGTRVYLGRAGGFDVRDCPEPEALAAFIVAACNGYATQPAVAPAAEHKYECFSPTGLQWAPLYVNTDAEADAAVEDGLGSAWRKTVGVAPAAQPAEGGKA